MWYGWAMTKLSDVKSSDLVAAVRKVAEENPKMRYTKPVGGTCAYFHSDQPGCIVGWGLAALGVSRDDLTDVDDINTGYSAVMLPIIWENESHRKWLAIVQDDQDNKSRWGRAVKHADAVTR